MVNILEIENVTKTYKMGKILVPALKGVTLKAEKGEIITILGPSGSGKSTLLHIIGALDKPSDGKVIVDKIDLSALSVNELADFRLHKVGFIFQFFNLLPRLTALENVELPLALANVSDKKSHEKASEVLNLVGLEKRKNHRPIEMSGGELQRVAIARALVNDPSIILADEPTGNLDTKTGFDIIQLVKRLNEEREQTFVVVTHDPAIAETADRIIHLKDGLVYSEDRNEVNR